MTDLKKLMERLQEKIDNGCHPPALSCQEEKILFRAAKEGDKQAKDLFVRCNLGICFKTENSD